MASTTAGYSGTPLHKKLGLQPGQRVLLVDAPAHYLDLLAPVPAGIHWCTEADAQVALVHLFVQARAQLEQQLTTLRATLASDAVLWVSWPKKVSRVATDITEDTVRALALPLGWVDVKVCAVDAVWSGLKLVVRRGLR